ncbi:MAG: hypothetical protein WDZ41_02145 [Candidatus Babeliales bacterium]
MKKILSLFIFIVMLPLYGGKDIIKKIKSVNILKSDAKKEDAEIWKDLYDLNFPLLDHALQEFIIDFKTWSKEDQKKIKIFSSCSKNNKPVLVEKTLNERYDIEDWLCLKIGDKRDSFATAIHYIQKYSTPGK